jgi:hypothetical protein
MLGQRKVKVAYRTKALGKVKHVVTRAAIDKASNSMQTKNVVVEEEMFMVFFPKGHSIRINKAELHRMNYHLQPRMIDMETGDVVDIGGDPYDFGVDDNAAKYSHVMISEDEKADDDFDLTEMIAQEKVEGKSKSQIEKAL